MPVGSGSACAKEITNCLRSQTLLNHAQDVQYFCPSSYHQADVGLFIKGSDKAELTQGDRTSQQSLLVSSNSLGKIWQVLCSSKHNSIISLYQAMAMAAHCF